MTETTSTEVARLTDQLERSFHGGAWHGPALAEALDGADAATAAARPVAGAHTIWEIVEHARFWIDAARRRIDGEAVEAHAPEDWPQPAEGPSPATWDDTLAQLGVAHRRLIARVRDLTDQRLDDPVSGSDPTVRGLLLGLLQHNAYHGGQIVLLRRAGTAA
jgi:uncharacterized damage-inducible protein DinB